MPGVAESAFDDTKSVDIRVRTGAEIAHGSPVACILDYLNREAGVFQQVAPVVG